MTFVISKLVGKGLQDYSTMQKFCKFSLNSCSIEGKFGFVSFDFSKFTGAQSCQLRFKRVSGNGLVAIISKDEATNYNIVSKVFENITVDLSKSKSFNVLRPSSGIGNIELMSVSLMSDSKVEHNDGIDMKVELNKCKRKFIRIVGNRVFANEGSSLQAAGKPIYVETEPPNMYKQEEGFTRFLGLCEIVKLKVNIKYIDKFPNFLEPVRNASSLAPVGEPSESGFENILERSLAFDFKPTESSTHQSKDTGILPGGMSIGRYGAIIIPDITIEKGFKYVLVMSAKNMDGNGRVSISISGSNLNKTLYIGPDDSVNIPFLTTDSGPYKLEINRSGPSDGNIWVSRIFISKNSAVHSHLSGIKGALTDPVIMKCLEKNMSIDNFKRDIQNFSSVDAETYGTPFNSDVVLNLKPCTHSMNKWVAKFANLFDGITVDSLLLKKCKYKGSNVSDSILMTDTDNLLKYKKIMLEEFNSSLANQQIDILKGTDVIFTPSLVNAQYLRGIPGIKRVLYVPKFWPFKPPEPRQVSKKYNLLISRTYSSTINFVNFYNVDKKLVVLGHRGTQLKVDTYNENIPYSKLLSLIYHADCVIDFPENIHYYSGLLDFALMAKKDIVTTNNWLGISKPESNVVKSVLTGKNLSPNYVQAVLDTYKSTGRAPNLDMESYNNNIKSSLMIMQEG